MAIDEGTQHLVILLTAAIKGQGRKRREVAHFGIGDRLVEIEPAESQIEAIA